MILFAQVRMFLPTFDQMKEQILSSSCGFDFSKPEKAFSIYVADCVVHEIIKVQTFRNLALK